MITIEEAIGLINEYKQVNDEDFIDFLTHAISVGACASILASACKLDIMKAGVMGYCHDIGKLISDEKKEKTFHGIIGYEFFNNMKEYELAQICLTHSFPNIDFEVEEYKSYGVENIIKTKELLKKVTINDYDLIVQMADLMVCIHGYSHLKNRMVFIKNKYHIDTKFMRLKYKNAIKLKKQIEQKFNINIYQLLGIK